MSSRVMNTGNVILEPVRACGVRILPWFTLFELPAVTRPSDHLYGHNREGGFVGALQSVYSLEGTGDKKCQAMVEEFLVEVCTPWLKRTEDTPLVENIDRFSRMIQLCSICTC